MAAVGPLRRAVLVGATAARAAPARSSLPTRAAPAFAAVGRRGLRGKAANGGAKPTAASSEPEPPSPVDALPQSAFKPSAPLDGPGEPSLPSSSSSKPVEPLDGPLDPTMEGAPDPLQTPQPSASGSSPPTEIPRSAPRPSLAESFLDRTQVIDSGTASSTQTALLRQTEGAFPGEPGRARPRSRERKTSAERKREKMFTAVLYAGVFGGLLALYHGGREWDSETEAVRLGSDKDVPGVMGIPRRAFARAQAFWNRNNEPLWEPLIPPPLPPPHQKPYTLVIDLECLVQPVWDAKHGWRTAKRPGIEYFLGYLAEMYEIVVFTTYPAYTAQPLLDLVDSLQLYITYRLFKESTHTIKGHPVKDLNYLGRDLSKVLIVDNDPANFSRHPENGVILPPLSGPDDTNLIRLIPFLEAVALLQVQDVRAVVRKYGQTGTAEAFRIEQARLRMKHIADWKAKGGKPVAASSGGGWLRSLGAALGFASPPPPPMPTFDDGAPPMLLDILRARQQRLYAENVKFFNENRPAMEAQQKADQEKAMREMKTSVFGFFSGDLGQPAPGERKPEEREEEEDERRLDDEQRRKELERGRTTR